ncbi:MAG: IS200/IS605 family transposase [Deltaproteobacteria bacterium]|nr:MAG: IS200/IS605 family transposase [Deltaproteobacteria bacterium]
MKSSNNAVFQIHYHLVLVTKYRRKVIDEAVKQRLFEIFTDLCERWDCDLQEFNSDEDHVHLLLDGRPEVKPSTLINNLKTVSSRYIRKEFPRLRRSNQAFWSPSYCLVSCGGAPLEIIKAYIENQGAKDKS